MTAETSDFASLVPNTAAIELWFRSMGPDEVREELEVAAAEFDDVDETPDPIERAFGYIDIVNDCPGFADGYTHLGIVVPEVGGLMAARALHASVLALGEQFEKRWRGKFWDAVETRPYMRALSLSASVASMDGDPTTAIATWKRMLRLHPRDALGTRYNLANMYAARGKFGELRRLSAKFADDVGIDLAYARAFVDYIDGEPCGQAIQALAANHHVPELLWAEIAGLATGDYAHAHDPIGFVPGSIGEAVRYVAEMGELWRGTGGAAWLVAVTREQRRAVDLAARRQLAAVADMAVKAPPGSEPH